MKEKLSSYSTDAEITAIGCSAVDAQINVYPASDGKFSVNFPDDKNISVGSSDSELYITQARRPFYSFKKQTIDVCVPEHLLPALSVNGKKYSLNIKKVIFGELEVNSDGGEINVEDCAFDSMNLTGSASPSLSDVTVKNGLTIQMKRGNVVILNSFATRAECRVKHGNIGLSALTCKDCILEAERGNVLAALSGNENDYNIKILIKEGSANRESVQREDATSSLQAYVEKGNVNVDFIDSAPKDGGQIQIVEAERTEENKSEEKEF